MQKPQKSSKVSISVLISDPTRLGCELLAQALTRGRYRFEITGCACSSSEVVAALQQRKSEVVLLSADLQDGPLAGLNILGQLLAEDPRLCTILILDKIDRDLVISAFRAGARGSFSRAGSLEDLGKCIYQVRNGQIWASSAELQYVLEALATAVPLRGAIDVSGNTLLTSREEDVVALVAEGLTNREIANKLKLSEHTVKNYLFRMFEKLGVSSRVELILYAMSHREQSNNREPAKNKPGKNKEDSPTAA
jgi:DNA-binding NarL/FixJ family response regulator